MKRLLVLGLAGFTAMNMAGCAPGPADMDATPQAIAQKLLGEYSNKAQYEASDSALKISPEIGDTRPWINQRFAVFKSVEIPDIPGEVVALEWREDDASGKISRQRLWAFRSSGTGIVMDFYAFKSEVDLSDRLSLSKLGMTDIVSYGEKCALPLTVKGRVYGFAIPDTCRIVTRSGRDMILSAQVNIGDALAYKEAGRLASGAPIFNVPGGDITYDFRRVKTPRP